MQRFTRSIPFFFSMFLLFPSLSFAQGLLGDQNIITTAADNAQSVFAADLDGDGDIDVLSALGVEDKIAWYENTDGLGSFGAQQVITIAADGAWSVFAADLDGDGDMDVLSASRNDDKIAWYENLRPITAVHGPATEIFGFALRPNYPNPFNPETIIRYQRYQLARTAEVKLEIYNLVGQKVTTLVDKKLSGGAHSVTWHGSDALGRPVASGVYIYRLQTDSFVESKKMLLLR